jgi:hypothetical protein
MAAGWSDPRDRVVREEADAIARELATAGRRTFDKPPAPDAATSAAWAGTCATLREQLTPATFELWIAPIVPIALRDDRLLIAAPAGNAAWIDRRYSAAIREAGDFEEIVVAAYGAAETTAPATAQKESTR